MEIIDDHYYLKININYKKKTATGNLNEELNSIDQSKKKKNKK